VATVADTRDRRWQLPRSVCVAEARKVSLTAKCPQTLQTPFLALFWLFQSHLLAKHPSLPCHYLAIAAACHGDICYLVIVLNYFVYRYLLVCIGMVVARFLPDCWQLPRDVLSDNESSVKLSRIDGWIEQMAGLVRASSYPEGIRYPTLERRVGVPVEMSRSAAYGGPPEREQP
jgi:hypothetical protein